MKAKMSYKSKKIAIITAIVLVLIGGISIGTYYYIKGNAESEATSGENNTVQNGLIINETDENNEDQNNVNNSVEETNNTLNNETSTNNETETNNTNTVNNNSDRNNGNSNNGNSSTSDNENDDEELPNEEYTQIDRIETGRQILVREGLAVGWINAGLNKANVSTDILVNRPELEVHKQAKINSINETDNAVQVGSKITYEITIKNNSKTVDAKSVTVTDNIPAGTVLDEETPISNGGVLSDGKITWLVDVNKESSVTVNFTVIVKNAEGNIKNVAVADGKDTEETSNPIISANKSVSSESNLEALKSGSKVKYTIQVTNNGEDIAKTTVKDVVPEGTTLVEGSALGAENISIENNTIIWNNVEINPGETKELTFEVTINEFEGESKVIENIALVGDTPTNPSDVTVYNPIIESEKTSNKSAVVVGEEIEYTITVTNSGKVAGEAVVKDTIPAGTTFVPGSIKVNGVATTLAEKDLNAGIAVSVEANGGTETISFRVTVNEGTEGSIINTAKVNDEDTPTTKNPVIDATKTVSAETAEKDDVLTYTITVTNTGDVAGTATIKDAIPTGTTLVEGSIDVSNDENTYTEANLKDGILVNVPAQGEVKLTFQVKVGDLSDGTVIKNQAKVNEEPTDETDTTYQEPVISSEKTSNKTAVAVGEQIEYTITATNNGTATGTAVIKDTVPAGTKFVEGSIKVNGEAKPELGETDLNNGIVEEVAANGGKVEVKFTVEVLEGAKGSIINTAKVNDEETPTTKNPVIDATKTVSAETAEKDDVLTYTITVTNTGDVEGKAIIKDTIPEGTTLVEGSIDVSNDENTYTEANLNDGILVNVPAQGEVKLTFQVKVGDLSDGTVIKNQAKVNEEPTDETETTYQEPVISSEKTSNKTAVAVGEQIEYTITATNNGTAAGEAVIKDTVPEGTTFVEGSIKVNGVERTDLTEADLNAGIPVEVTANGGKGTVSFRVTVNEGAEGSIINTATVNEVPTEEIKNPVIKATKSVDKEKAEKDDVLTYTITVTNTGDVAGTATIKDAIPTGTTLVEGSIDVSNDDNAYTEQNLKDGILVNVPAQGEVKLTFQVRVGDLEDETVIKNTAYVNEKPTDETETTYQKPEISAIKTSNKTAVVVGEEIEYTITATNNGTAAGEAVIKDTVPAGTTFVAGSIKVNGAERTDLTEADLNGGIPVEVAANGGKGTVSFKVTVNEGTEGSIINTATVNEVPTEEIKNPVIKATKSVDKEKAEKDDILTYTITVTNTGDVAGTATIKDAIPTGITLVEGSIDVSNDDNAYTEQNLKDGILVNVPAQGEVKLTFQVKVGDLEDETVIKNTAYVNEKPTDETETTYQEPEISAVKTSNKTAVAVGEQIEYTITATNNGTAAGTAVIKDTVPAGTKFVEGSIKVNGETKPELGEIDLNNGIVEEIAANGGKVEVKFTVEVLEGAEGSIINTATVNEVPTEEIKNPVIDATKTVSAETAEKDDVLTYTITVTNTGDVAGTATIKDTIPEGTTFVEGSIDVSNDENTYTEANLNEGIEVNVPAQGEVTLTFEVKVGDLSDGTVIKNQARVNEEPTDETETTYQEPVISSKKTSNKTAVAVGEQIEYTITATNNGTAAGEAVIKDTVPTGTTFVEGSIKVNGAERTDLTEADLNGGIPVEVTANGGTGTVSFKVTVNEGTEGSIINTAKVNDEETPTTKNPVIDATKTVSAETAEKDDVLTYTITVTNTGDVEGKATIKDTIPEGTTLVEGSIDVSNDENTYTEANLNEGIEVNVPAQGEVKLTFQVKVGDLSDGTVIKNQAKVNEEPTDETETTYQEPEISAVKTSNKTAVAVGEQIEYTITATNNGTAAGEAVIKDTVPEGTTFVEGSIKVNGAERTDLTEADLNSGIPVEVAANGGTGTVSFKVTVNEGTEGSIINTAKVNDEETPTTKNPVIDATKTVSAETAEKDDVLTYTITVTNTGDIAGTVIIKDEVPEGTTFVENSIKIDNRETNYTEQDLAKGISVTVLTMKPTILTFEVKVGDLSDGTVIKNQAKVNEEPTDETETTYQEPVISSEKTSNKTAVAVGEQIEYTITAINNGTAAGEAVIKDTVPTGTTFVEGSIKVNGTERTDLTEADLNAGIPVEVIANGGKGTVSFKVTVNEGAEGSIINTAKVNDENTPSTDNPVIKATKSVSKDTTKQGDTLTYTITVINTGNVAGTATVKDTIPTGTTLVEGSIDVSNDENTYTEANLNDGILVNVPAQGEVKLTFQVIVGELENNTEIKNTATVNDKPTNETETVYKEPELKISKTAKTVLDRDENGTIIPGQSEDEAEIGDTIIYTITVTNESDIEAEEVNVVDTLPTQVTYVNNSIATIGGSQNATYDSANRQIKYSGTLQAKGTLTITFKVTVNKGTPVGEDVIKNIAILNDTKQDDATTDVVKKLRVTTTAETVNALDIVLVLDTSGSMKDPGSNEQTRLQNLKDAATSLVNKVFSTETNSTITAITYDTDVNWGTTTYTYRQKQQLLYKIQYLGADGGTNIYKALEETNRVVDNMDATNRNRVVVFLTDGAPTFYTGQSGIEYIDVNTGSEREYKNNLRPQIIEQAKKLKAKENVEVYAVGLGVDKLDDKSVVQYVEKTPPQSERNYFDGYNRSWRYWYMYEKTYAQYLLNNISSSGEYIETSDLDKTFNDILSEHTTSEYMYDAKDTPLTIEVPEAREIISDITVIIGNTGNETTYTVEELIQGRNGIKYTPGKGFTWTITDPQILNSDLHISYRVKGVAE